MSWKTGKALTAKVWLANDNDVDEAPRGLTRADEENHNTLRIGRLVLAWGVEGGQEICRICRRTDAGCQPHPAIVGMWVCAALRPGSVVHSQMFIDEAAAWPVPQARPFGEGR